MNHWDLATLIGGAALVGLCVLLIALLLGI